MNFPASLDNGSSLPNPTTANNTNNPSHAGLHASENAAIIAVETKVGIGSSTPASNTLLIGTGAGTSAWSALTSAQLASVLSDETGSGSVVFANTPVLITPKVDTINENTVGNGVTVGGVNLKSGAVGSNGVVTASITDAAVTPAKLVAGTGSSWVWSSYTPTVVGFSATTTNLGRYQQIGKTVILNFDVDGTSNATNFTLTVPIVAKATPNIFFEGILTFLKGSGGAFSQIGKIFLDPNTNTTVATLYIDLVGTVWSSSGTKGARGTLIYEAA